MKKVVFSLILIFFLFFGLKAQLNQTALILDLKKARAIYERAKNKYENNTKLIENKAISEDEYSQSKNEILMAEVDYQKLLLQLISQQYFLTIDKAIKYQNKNGEKRVKLTIKSESGGNKEYMDQFKEHFDVFSPEMRSNKIYNIFVSLLSSDDNVIVGTPYELIIPSLNMGETAVADFHLLKDIDRVRVSIKSTGQAELKNIYLEKDASANYIDISSSQFSLEGNLGSEVNYNLTLEKFSSSEDLYQLILINLPKHISSQFSDIESNARLTQVQFNQGVNSRKLQLKTFLPERDDDIIVIDKPIEFYVVAITNENFKKIGDFNKTFTSDEIDGFSSGKLRLELVPRGIGKIEIRTPNLYHEIKIGEKVDMVINISNTGTRSLNNIKISSDAPMNWECNIKPDLIKELNVGQEIEVKIAIIPSSEVGIGAQEIRLKTEALVNNNRIESDDKRIRIQVQANTPIFGTIMLVLLLIVIIAGIAYFGIKISKR